MSADSFKGPKVPSSLTGRINGWTSIPTWSLGVWPSRTDWRRISISCKIYSAGLGADRSRKVSFPLAMETRSTASSARILSGPSGDGMGARDGVLGNSTPVRPMVETFRTPFLFLMTVITGSWSVISSTSTLPLSRDRSLTPTSSDVREVKGLEPNAGSSSTTNPATRAPIRGQIVRRMSCS